MHHWKYIVLSFMLSVKISAQETEKNQVYLADPTIFKDNGIYYLYGTKNDPRIEGEGFLVYTSKDLKNWRGPAGVKEGFALKKGDAFGTKGFWAPQVFKYKSKYYMAYTANEHIAIATANSPLGPFTNDKTALEAPIKQIDPFVFFDNGKVYMYHVRLQQGNRIFVAEMTKDLKQIKPETLKECINAREDWENTENAEWPVSEGPTVMKKGNLYYLLYSANDFRNPDYAVGYAVSDNPLGPWKKAGENPIISTGNTGQPGTGHGDIITDGNGSMYYVLHTHYSDKKVHPRKTALVKLLFKDNKFKIDPGSFRWIGL
ncbi:glycoside hydrolase family 43 protein [Sinomicrobium kalidii]|uniref:glycoside hydrolase family 43 protein n=1 Tax=Sinomicrobium kalidii TaxID=2900738 RepID=UPI001E3862E9|nr:glycoside hydrolase family 43 protein [Sinomicrobium kalidii]UGU15701.1 glycoside hydrolase family 43 protein [Sinomicrobium kalidii]